MVAQAELLPVLVAMKLYTEVFKHRLLLVFIDNEGARAGLISATSAVEDNADIIHAITSMEDLLSVKAWYTRVPSSSNCADPPSRSRMAETARRFAREVPMLVPKDDWFAVPDG